MTLTDVLENLITV